MRTLTEKQYAIIQSALALSGYAIGNCVVQVNQKDEWGQAWDAIAKAEKILDEIPKNPLHP